MKPKKLIRHLIIDKLKIGEWEIVEDQEELNNLYELKIIEELAEIKASDHTDVMEFVDLIQVCFSFAKQNGITHDQLSKGLLEKSLNKGMFGKIALNNLNPENPSNALYFKNQASKDGQEDNLNLSETEFTEKVFKVIKKKNER